MKKILMALVVSLCFVFTACTSKDDKKPEDKVEVNENTDEKNPSETENEGKQDEDSSKTDETPKQLVLDEAKEKELKDKYEKVVEAFNKRDKDTFFALSTDKIKESLGENELDLFDKVEEDLGKFKEIDFSTIDYRVEQGYYLVDAELIFEKGKVAQLLAFDENFKHDGLNFSNVYKFVEPDENEEKVTIDDGDGYPVEAMLAKPEGEVKGAVLLIDGTGPGDMDFTVGDNKFFKKLSDELREQGLMVLRFNKRNYQYSRPLEKAGKVNESSLEEEYVGHAIQGLKDLKEKYAPADSKIILLGHSVAGAILPYINHESGDLANAYIAVSSSPDKLWELQEAQLRKILEEGEELEDVVKENIEKNIQSNIELVGKLDELSEEELKDPKNFPFGVPAKYLRDLNRLDSKELYTADKRPVLIINGEFDSELKPNTSKAWKDVLASKENASIEEIKNSNHLMQEVKGKEKMTEVASSEYSKDLPLVDKFKEHLSQFIFEQLISSSTK